MPVKLPGMQIEHDDLLAILGWKFGFSPVSVGAQQITKIRFVPYEAFDGLVDSNPNGIGVADLYATISMNSLIDAKATVSLASLLRDPAEVLYLNTWLIGIPVGANPETARVRRNAVRLLARLIALDNFGEAVACKLLCRKRPALFPMWDSRVAEYVKREAQLVRVTGATAPDLRAKRLWAGTQWLWKQVRRNREDLNSVADRLTQGASLLQTFVQPITPLRVIESLIWLGMSYPTKSRTRDDRLTWRPDMWDPQRWRDGVNFETFGLGWRQYCERFEDADTSYRVNGPPASISSPDQNTLTIVGNGLER